MFIRVPAVYYALLTENALLITNFLLTPCLDQYVIGWANDEAATFGVRIFDKCTNKW